MTFGQLHHVEYYVNDISRSNSFWDWFMIQMDYVKLNEWNGGASWTHSSGTYLVFVQVNEQFLNLKNNRQGNGLNHIAFVGKSVEHLDRLENNLKKRNVKILKRDGVYLCFEDLNEFAVEVYAQNN
jgi:hypothetical protein